MRKYFLYNKLSKFYFDNCKKCSIRFGCPKGCMLLSEDELKNFYCVQNKMHFEPIIEILMSLTV